MGKEVIPIERIARAILVIRGEKVMSDSDFAALYGVTTGNLNKAVRRNAERFPTDFMFQLDAEEVANLKFQFGISSWGGRRRLPYAFTEQGVAMLSSVLNSERAVKARATCRQVRRRNCRDSGGDPAVDGAAGETARRDWFSCARERGALSSA
jgi:hypothetical protein